MVKQLRFLATILLFCVPTVYGQVNIKNFNYQNRIVDAGFYFKDTLTNHSSILPQISFVSNNSLGCYNPSQEKATRFGRFYPLSDISVGIETKSTSIPNLLLTTGIGLGFDWSAPKLFFTGKFLPYYTKSPYVRDSVQQHLDRDIGASRSLLKNTYQQNEWIMGYRPNSIFTFMLGNGRNFFGEGYRSLILSDNGGSTPFFKIETSLKSIKYVNLYQLWNDNTIDPSNRSLDRKKFAAMHYISWNITREFNLSIFESVVWQAKDTLLNRGFDPSYLNPIVFYRPVEYNNGSADNVLLGANMSFKFNRKHSIYTQVLLDDFLLAEIRAHSRWWANKYAFQFGYKSREFLGKKNLYFQGEFNVVRPFTYSHKTSLQSYGHLNSSVAHPIGANFFEVLGILAYQTANLQWTGKITYSSYGVDTSAVSYGQNIFVPYGNRAGEYDQKIMQGFKKNVLNTTLMIEKPLVKKMDLYANLTYNWRMEINPIGVQNQHYLTVGIRSRIWNQYSDY